MRLPWVYYQVEFDKAFIFDTSRWQAEFTKALLGLHPLVINWRGDGSNRILENPD